VVTLGAFYAVEGQPVPSLTVPGDPYNRGVEATLSGDGNALFIALRELLEFVAGNLDGADNASLYEAIEDDPRLAARVELETQLLRDAAERLDELRVRITERLAGGGAT
jgi:hypothetical protein